MTAPQLVLKPGNMEKQLFWLHPEGLTVSLSPQSFMLNQANRLLEVVLILSPISFGKKANKHFFFSNDKPEKISER